MLLREDTIRVWSFEAGLAGESAADLIFRFVSFFWDKNSIYPVCFPRKFIAFPLEG